MQIPHMDLSLTSLLCLIGFGTMIYLVIKIICKFPGAFILLTLCATLAFYRDQWVDALENMIGQCQQTRSTLIAPIASAELLGG